MFIICFSQTFEPFSGRLRNATEERHQRSGAVSGTETDGEWGRQEPKDESKKQMKTACHALIQTLVPLPQVFIVLRVGRDFHRTRKKTIDVVGKP